ncbi:unnamed protein product [Chrysoparadoxa australica]
MPSTPSADLRGKVMIVTGSNTGIGKATAKALSSQGATVILACRSEKRAQEALKDFQEAARHQDQEPGPVVYINLDLSSLKSVEEFARSFKARYSRLDALVNNAGVSGQGSGDTLTADGLGWTFGVNFISHFHLTTCLLDVIKATPGSRIVNLASVFSRFAGSREMSKWMEIVPPERSLYESNYAESKFAMVLLTVELRRRFQAAGVSCQSFAVDPGAVQSDIWREVEPGVGAGSPFFSLRVSHYFPFLQIPSFIKPIFSAVMKVMFLSNSQGCFPSVWAASAPLEAIQSLSSSSTDMPLYLQPYWLPFGIPLPFEILGPFIGCAAAWPPLPAAAREKGEKLWALMEKAIADATSGQEKENRKTR